MKYSKEAVAIACSIPEKEIHAYADKEAETVFDRDENKRRKATEHEASVVSALIYSGIIAGRFTRDGYGNMTANTVRAAANTVETAGNVFLPSLNNYETVFCPVRAWFTNNLTL